MKKFNGRANGLALPTENGNLFINCYDFCFFTKADKKTVINISTPERWRSSLLAWNVEAEEVEISEKLIQGVSRLIEVDDYEDHVSENLTEYGKIYIIYQRNGDVEKIIYIDSCNHHGYEGVIGHESYSLIKVKRFLNGKEMIKGSGKLARRSA